MTSRWAAAIVLLLVCLSVSAEDWVTGTGGRPDRSGRSSEHGPTAPAILWDECPKVALNGVQSVIGGSTVVSSRVYYGDIVTDTWIVAQDLENGDERWSTQLPINFPDSWWSHAMAIRDGHVYATRAGNTNQEYLYALKVEDGTEDWHSDDLIDPSVAETPSFTPEGDLIVGNFTSILRINHTNGDTQWEALRQCPSSSGCEAAVSGDRVYAWEVVDSPGGLQHLITAYDLATGERLYASDPLRTEFFGIQDTAPFAGSDGAVYAPLANNTPSDALVSLTDSGTALTENWRVPIGYVPFSSFGVGPDGSVYAYSTDLEVLRLDPANGHVLNTSIVLYPADYLSPKMAIDARGRVFVTNTFANLFAFDADLRLRWAESVPEVGYGGPALGSDGTLVVTGAGTTVRAYRTPFSGDSPLRVDASAAAASNANGVLEPGETVGVETAWENGTHADEALTGAASNLAGPGGGAYTVDDGSADYGLVAAGGTSNCGEATGDCFVMTVGDPGARPAAHWDATFDDVLSAGADRSWTLHVGASFPDVPVSDIFYAFVENILHNGVTAGCGTDYCRNSGVTRAQMAVFLLKARHGPLLTPPPATGAVFEDVPAGSFAADWIEELAREGITGGCSVAPALYCPGDIVTRAQMAVFLLKAEHGKRFVPPACAGVFSDVACPGGFAVDWIERLAAEGVTAGCGGGAYCPDSPNTRGQMAPFLVKTFGLKLYGP